MTSTSTQTNFIRIKDACRKCSISKTTLYRLSNQGKFPPIVKLGPRTSGFIEADLDAWIRERANSHA